MVSWSCPGFLPELIQTSSSMEWSLTPSSHLKTMCMVLFPVSVRKLVFWGSWNVHLWTPLYYFAFVFPIPEDCSSVWVSAAECRLQFLSARSIRWPGFVLIRVSCRCVIDVILLSWVYCKRLIRTPISVCSGGFHLLLLEFDIRGLRRSSSIGVWSMKVQNVPICKVIPAGPGSTVEWPTLYCLDAGTLETGTVECWMPQPLILCFKGAVNRWLLLWVVFSSVFRGTGACGIAKET